MVLARGPMQQHHWQCTGSALLQIHHIYIYINNDEDCNTRLKKGGAESGHPPG